MSVDQATVRRIARLARIAVSDAEAVEATAQLNGLLDLIGELQAVDTTGI